MKRVLLGLFTLLVLFFFTPIVGVFAAESHADKTEITSSGVTSSGGISGTGEITDLDEESEKEKKDKKKSEKEDSDFSSEDKEKVQQEINMYILEVYKLQGSKILKDIDVSLQKINTDSETRIKAYARIQRTLEMRRKRVQNMDLSENNKAILTAYLQYMITALEKKQANLKD